MNARVLLLLASVVATSAAGCGDDGLSEASTQACSAGKASAEQARELLAVAPPEFMIEMASSKAPEFDELAGKADNEDVKTALTDLSKTFADFRPDMSKVPTALQRNPEFAKYIDDFKASVQDRSDKLNATCG